MNKERMGMAMQSDPMTRGKGSSLEIYVLGGFDVRKNGHSLVVSDDIITKPWVLLQYLLVSKRQWILIEDLSRAFWPEGHGNPRRSLHLTVHRLRKLLRDGGEGQDGIQWIKEKDGMYSFNWDEDYYMDAEEFHHLCMHLQSGDTPGSGEVQKLFERALHLYRGDYLVEQRDSWAISPRELFRSMYRRMLLDYTDFLHTQGQYDRIVRVCREVPKERMDEELHGRVIQALLLQGNLKAARFQYEQVTQHLYEEYGLAPSKKLRALYRLICIGEEGEPYIDLAHASRTFELAQRKPGPLVCTSDVFAHLCSLERRRFPRSKESMWIMTITIEQDDSACISPEQWESVVSGLMGILKSTLRQGDSICRWNTLQFLALLVSTASEGAQQAADRIKDRFNALGCSTVKLRIDLRPLTGAT